MRAGANNIRNFPIKTTTEQNTTDASATNISPGRRSSWDVEFQLGILLRLDIPNTI